MYKKAIVIGEQTLGKDHPKLAIRYNNLADVYQDQASSCENPPLCLAVRWRLVGVWKTQSHPQVHCHFQVFKYAVIFSSTPRRT